METNSASSSIVPDAIATYADTLISIAGVQSNHTRRVAAVAAKTGMKCLLVQESWVPSAVIHDPALLHSYAHQSSREHLGICARTTSPSASAAKSSINQSGLELLRQQQRASSPP
ncbi:conserved hypothetical protein (plasmid) [Sinorhizobium fredii HH103]|nr:conserved hypothetical protein [Sinorhizobium fredii HH103]